MAVVAYKVNMMIVVMAFGTFVFAKGIADRIIGSGNRMNDPFVNKGL